MLNNVKNDRLALGLVVALWTGAVVLGFLAAQSVPLTRVQEARVLSTAMEMAAGDAQSWLVPHLNGLPRLQKPPLAYWTVAALFEWLPDDLWLARLPFHVASWMTVLALGAFAWRLAGRRTGLLSGGFLAGMYLFRRYTIYAETDVEVVLFVTVAAWAMWEYARGAACLPPSLPLAGSAGRPTVRPYCATRVRGWAHLAGLMMGLTVLTKGLQAGMPLLFLIALSLLARRPSVIGRWVLSAAPMTMLVVAAPWFVYIMGTPEWTTLLHEVDVAVEGGAHERSFWYYGPKLIQAALPWSPLSALALIFAVSRWRSSDAARIGLLWLGSVVVPLTIVAQKQGHYVVVALPPLALLTGWATDAMLLGPEGRFKRLGRALQDGPVIAMGVAGLALIAISLFPWSNSDVGTTAKYAAAAAAAGMGIVVACSLAIFGVRRGDGVRLMANLAAVAVAMASILGVWEPARHRITVADVAACLRSDFGDRPRVLYGAVDPILLFLAGGPMRILRDESMIAALLVEQPDVLVVGRHGVAAPHRRVHGMRVVREFKVDDIEYDILLAAKHAGVPAPPQ